MYLYDKKENGYEVYSMTIDKMSAYLYRNAQIEKIKSDRRVLYFEERVKNLLDKPLFAHYKNEIEVPIEEVFISQGNHYRILKTSSMDSSMKECLIGKYKLGKFSHSRVVKICSPKEFRYLLLTKEARSVSNDHSIMAMTNIIELPKSLFLLQLLEQEKYAYLGYEDLSEQIDLFTKEKVGMVSTEELARMDRCGITKNASNEILKKSEEHEKVLKYIRR